MGTYENPDKKPISTKGRAIGAGIQRMVTGFANDKIARDGKKARDEEEAAALLKQRSSRASSVFDSGYDSITDDINSFSQDLGAGNRNVFKQEIINLLDGKRDEISDWIKNNPEASQTEITAKINSGTEYMGNLQNTLTGLSLAREEYLAARDLGAGEKGALVPGYNPDLIKFFEAQERNDPNMHFTVDDNGEFRISVVNEEELGNAMNNMSDDQQLEFTSFNASNMVKSHADGNPFFRTVQPFDYSEMQTTIDNSIRKGDKDLGTVDKDGNITYNKAAVQDFYKTTPNGQAILQSYSEDPDAQGHWLGMGEKVIVDDEVTYTNNSANFNTGFQPALLDGFLEGLPEAAPTIRKAPVGNTKKVVEETVTEKAGKEESSMFSDFIEEGKAESLTESPVEFQPITAAEWGGSEEDFMNTVDLERRFPGFEFKIPWKAGDKISVKAPGQTEFTSFNMNSAYGKGAKSQRRINSYIEKHMNKSSSKPNKTIEKTSEEIKIDENL